MPSTATLAEALSALTVATVLLLDVLLPGSLEIGTTLMGVVLPALTCETAVLVRAVSAAPAPASALDPPPPPQAVRVSISVQVSARDMADRAKWGSMIGRGLASIGGGALRRRWLLGHQAAFEWAEMPCLHPVFRAQAVLGLAAPALRSGP
jgi:hypothetical protein